MPRACFFEVAASSADDACQRVAHYYEQEGWAPASASVAQRVPRQHNGLRCLYRQRWEDVLPLAHETLEEAWPAAALATTVAEFSAPVPDADGQPVAVGAREPPEEPPAINT